MKRNFETLILKPLSLAGDSGLEECCRKVGQQTSGCQNSISEIENRDLYGLVLIKCASKRALST